MSLTKLKIVTAFVVALVAIGNSLSNGVEEKPEKNAGQLPQRPMPYWANVTVDQDGKFVVSVPMVGYETKYAKTEKDGEKIEVYYYERIANEVTHHFQATETRAFNAQGKEIDVKDLQKRLSGKTTVLVSTDGRKVPAYYLRNLKEDTLVLVFSNTLFSPNSPPGAEPFMPSGVEHGKWNGPLKGLGPCWVNVSIDKEGKFKVDVPNVTYKAGTAKIKKNGEEIEAYFFDPVASENVKVFDSKDVQVSTAGGKEIDYKEAQTLLGEGKMMALASIDKKKVDPFYLAIFKDDTLVLVISKPLWDSPAPQYSVPPASTDP